MAAAVPIVTLSLNPAIDQTAVIANFTAGTVNRVEQEQSDPGGKGINVASFLAHVGLKVAATGFLGNANDSLFVQLFAAKGIEDRCVRVQGQTRVNIKILDPIGDRVTDINFPGLAVNAADLTRLMDALDALAGESDWFVLSGSIPAGVPDGIYDDLVRRLKARGKRVLLDGSGPAFALAIDASPDIVKPNIDELRELLGEPLASESEVLAGARTLIERGVGLVAVSMGGEGALFVERDHAVRAVPPRIKVRSTVGAGDAMVAGLLASTLRGFDLADRARLATAFSVGALGEIGPKLPAPSVIESGMGKVDIHPLSRGR
jgi:1-phosphofructokinase